MNPWDLVLNALGWAVLLILSLVIVLIILGVVKSCIKTFKKRAEPTQNALSDEVVLELATKEAKHLFDSDLLFKQVRTIEFLNGVKYVLATQRGETDANRI